MFRIIISMLTGAHLLLATTLASATLSEATADKLLERSGFSAQLALVQEAIEITGIAAAKENIQDEDDWFAFASIVEASLNEAAIVKQVSIALRDAISEDEAAVLLTWFESSLGRAIVKAQQNAATASVQREIERRKNALLLGERRVQYARKINQFQYNINLTISLQDQAELRIYAAVASAIDRRARPNDKQLRDALTTTRAQRRANKADFATLVNVHAFKKISFDDIDRYLHWLQTPEATNFSDAVQYAMETQLLLGIDELSAKLAAHYLAQQALKKQHAVDAL